MPTFSPADIEESLSLMHALRHDVRASLHHAGADELLEWQELESKTVEMDAHARREPDVFRRRLGHVIERLSRLRATMKR